MTVKAATVAELEAQHAELETAITNTLKTGQPTLELHRQLKECTARLQEARNAAGAAAAAAAEREQAEIRERAAASGRVTAASAVAGIEASISHLAVPATPDLSSASLHPAHEASIASAAANLALAEQRHADAAQLHNNAMREIADVERRVADAQTKHGVIVADRREGRTSDQQEARLYALSSDITDLSGMLEQLRATASSLSTNATSQAVADARRAFDRATAEARVALLADHVTAVTDVLENALRELEQSGRMVGKSMHLLWRPSPAMRQCLNTGQMPAQLQRVG